MINKTNFICTIGPSSFNKDTLAKAHSRGVDFFRINLSHTPIEEIEEKIKKNEKLGISADARY